MARGRRFFGVGVSCPQGRSPACGPWGSTLGPGLGMGFGVGGPWGLPAWPLTVRGRLKAKTGIEFVGSQGRFPRGSGPFRGSKSGGARFRGLWFQSYAGKRPVPPCGVRANRVPDVIVKAKMLKGAL